ncbi:hypothetical protein V9T40_002485 [Parthenolecanium corni]|uniref:Uncharacterized protein n=1 Tax=Parthenolecanium corni TaxID=536013 RepID=A0AAN9TGB5_9HEMI
MSGTLNTCEEEYAKDPNIKPEDIRSLKQWLEKEPHLPKVKAMQVKSMLTLIMEQGICPGYAFIFDFEGYGFSHMASVNLLLLKKLAYFSQIHIYNSTETLCNHFGSENIPVEMGGQLPQTRDELTKNFKKRFDLLSNDVQEEQDRRADDSLRNVRKQNDSSPSYGSFKKISID